MVRVGDQSFDARHLLQKLDERPGIERMEYRLGIGRQTIRVIGLFQPLVTTRVLGFFFSYGEPFIADVYAARRIRSVIPPLFHPAQKSLVGAA